MISGRTLCRNSLPGYLCACKRTQEPRATAQFACARLADTVGNFLKLVRLGGADTAIELVEAFGNLRKAMVEGGFELGESATQLEFQHHFNIRGLLGDAPIKISHHLGNLEKEPLVPLLGAAHGSNLGDQFCILPGEKSIERLTLQTLGKSVGLNHVGLQVRGIVSDHV